MGFRPTVYRIASSMDLDGYVQNNGSNVVIEVNRRGEEFLTRLKDNLPPLARIDSLQVFEGSSELREGFSIIPSENGKRGVGIPNDVAVCDSCLEELFDASDRRYMYPFTNCTDCGARFTLIEDLPYDRGMTSMRSFPMCDECREEYEDPEDRRFHHQTISCPRCGPQYSLYHSQQEMIDTDPIRGFARRMDERAIGAAKSWGGMHICCTLDSVQKLREWYGRKEKPFAIMVRDLEAAGRYGVPNNLECDILTSPHRPVTLIEKKGEVEGVSPGLNNIGVFLPYTAMHHMLFHYLDADALITTSANIPGEPMILDDTVFSLDVDCYLLHDREIINRCDDSVLRVFDQNRSFLRKSRGHIPSPLPFPIQGKAIGLGAQENISGALASGGRLFPTQYIGDGDSLGVMDFLRSSLQYFMRLLEVEEVDAVGMDMHPGYSNRSLGKELAEELGGELIEVQHHWAHAASLMIDAGVDEIVALTVDGTGYGADGGAWGGEILHTTFEDFERVGHLQPIPLLGGEKAVEEVDRLLFAIREMLGEEHRGFSEREVEVFEKMLPSAPVTTSLGRVLDALSCHLGVCCKRSYEGEPAIKLEALLGRGEKEHEFDVATEGKTLLTLPMFEELFEMEGKKEDLAHSFVHDLVRGMTDMAIEEAQSAGVECIGITGGVAYNATISKMVKQRVEGRGMKFVSHDDIPPGDGGISVGQCAIALSEVLSER